MNLRFNDFLINLAPAVLITFAVVNLRYVYSDGWVWLQESYVWLHGVVFMVGAG